MSSPIIKERSDLPSPRQEVEETTCYEDYDSDDCDSDEHDEALDRFNEETEKSQGFEMDFSKFKYTFGWKQVDLDDTRYMDETQTYRDLMVILVKEALSKYNAEQKTYLKLDKILRANFFLSAGITYYISFLVNDLSNGNETKPYRAVVQDHVTGKINVYSCNPKPPSSSYIKRSL